MLAVANKPLPNETVARFNTNDAAFFNKSSHQTLDGLQTRINHFSKDSAKRYLAAFLINSLKSVIKDVSDDYKA